MRAILVLITLTFSIASIAAEPQTRTVRRPVRNRNLYQEHAEAMKRGDEKKVWSTEAAPTQLLDAHVLKMESIGDEREMEFRVGDAKGRGLGKVRIASNRFSRYFVEALLAAWQTRAKVDLWTDDRGYVTRVEVEPDYGDLPSLQLAFGPKTATSDGSFEMQFHRVGDSHSPETAKIKDDARAPYFFQQLLAALNAGVKAEVRTDNEGFVSRIELERK